MAYQIATPSASLGQAKLQQQLGQQRLAEIEAQKPSAWSEILNTLKTGVSMARDITGIYTDIEKIDEMALQRGLQQQQIDVQKEQMKGEAQTKQMQLSEQQRHNKALEMMEKLKLDSESKKTKAEAAKSEESLRKEYLSSPELKSFQNAQLAKDKISGLFDEKKQISGVDDIAAINTAQKIIDEGAVVREADVDLIRSANGLFSRYKAELQKQGEGGLLLPDQRKELKDMVNKIYEAVKIKKDENDSWYLDIAMRRDFDVRNIMKNLPNVKDEMKTAQVDQKPSSSQVSNESYQKALEFLYKDSANAVAAKTPTFNFTPSRPRPTGPGLLGGR